MLNYDLGKNEWKNWLIEESDFSAKVLGKTETIMALGNGYLGVRSCTEEDYLKQKRNLFINGTFNCFSDKEVSELPNLPDVLAMELEIDGYHFSLELGTIKAYSKVLNLKTGLLSRKISWEMPNGKLVELDFQRFVSMKNKHLLASKLKIQASEPVEIKIISGINGQVSNSGSQHLNEEDMRFFDKTYLQMNSSTTQSQILISTNTMHKVSVDTVSSMAMDRRRMDQTFAFTLDGSVEIEKISLYYTSIDKDMEGKDDKQIKEFAYNTLKSTSQLGFDALAQASAQAWEEEVWQSYPIIIESRNNYDELAARFAIYHMVIMTPAHDHRMGIGAKGMTGEGYKGHSFWDTEIFILPFYIFSNPAIARSLLEYRYLGLEGARKKARDNGYQGAMYPWEAAWPADGEVTPVWGAVDIVTGEQTKIWSGFIEIHITSDITFMLWRYYLSTKDQDFMNRYGYEIIFDTANFWSSRYEWNEALGRYEITDVVGPDEYKEHADNNAFTNYMSAFNLRLALTCAESLLQDNPVLYAALDEKLDIKTFKPLWQERLDKIYLPLPTSEGIIPQDDAYLTLPEIDLTKYKSQEQVGGLFLDYNLDQVNKLQVTKQADIMMLFYLLEEKFAAEIKKANYDYYEPKTLHDSSLSLSTHCIMANDLGDYDKAYELFERAARIDLGPNMKSSDHGIHAAAQGGLWQCITMGFGGLRIKEGQLHCNPRLPEAWQHLEFAFYWQGVRCLFTITSSSLQIETPTGAEVEIIIHGQKHLIKDSLRVALARED